MCKSIALLSGKGGSGKTTLALSMATMLSNCGVKVLLVDCDLSTNGATYFYEEKLSAKKSKITSFYDMLYNEGRQKRKCVSINENYDFIPSVTQITKENTKTYSYVDGTKFNIYNDLCQKYEVILFDCQAGYTDILKLILPHVDINLMVMESDAISSAAIRSLYLKIGEVINEKKVYQVFNKASNEEYDIYSKVSGGTVFTNIETIKFDWKIRKAFSISQIPDLENTSANYGLQIFNVCKILFTAESIQAKLKKFETMLNLHFHQERETALKEKMLSLKSDHSSKKSRMNKMIATMLPLICAVVLCAVFLVAMDFKENFSDMALVASLLTGLLTVAFSMFSLYESTKEKRDYENELNSYREELDELVVQRKKLQDKLDAVEESTSN